MLERADAVYIDASRWSVVASKGIFLAGRARAQARLYTMAIPVVEFSREGYKIRKVFG